ncbi:Alpha/Beta hydrolase protein [Aspergillus pseudoustus]|uniref:Alpha/Beta hydrolase protein n=1 Tax=Aspergillus pseudoustus TaxID=1810923 RepID=A0ABR4JZ24_9EURO
MASFLAFARYLYLRALVTLSRLLLKLLTPPLKPRPDDVLHIPSREKHRAIKVHVYKPPIENAGNNPTCILINLCGTGLAIPFHGMDDNFCRFIANTTGHTVLDVEYRLAPEHPFPASLHDVQDTVQYVRDHSNKKENDTSPSLSISGFSSGGTLALAACTTLPRGTFKSLIAFYPATDLSTDPSLRKAPTTTAGGKEKKRSPFWTRIFRESYIRDMDARDPRISPAFADPAVFPRNVLVVTGELDASALEAEELAGRIKIDGEREVLLRRMTGCGHAFDKKLTGDVVVEARKEAYGLAAQVLNKVH